MYSTIGEDVAPHQARDDPRVVGVRANPAFIGRPADATDRPRELPLARSAALAVVRAVTRAIDGHEPRPGRFCDADHSLAVQPRAEQQELVIVDQRDVETLLRRTNINTKPAPHSTKIAKSSSLRRAARLSRQHQRLARSGDAHRWRRMLGDGVLEPL